MDVVQSKIVSLLQEIHNTCEKLEIEYILGGFTAEEATCFNRFTPGRYTATVYMTLNDLMKFRDFVKENLDETRVVEGLNNNSRMPGFFFRYVDKTTTFYDYKYGNTYRFNGIHVRIEILRRYRKSNKIKRLKNSERGFAFNSYRYRRILGFKSLMSKWEMGIRLLFGRKSAAKSLYKRCCKAYMEGEDFATHYMLFNRKKNKMVKYPSYMLHGRKLVEFEGVKLYVPYSIQQHTALLAEREPVEKLQEGINNPSIIVSDVIPYEEYITEKKSRKKVAALRQRIFYSDIAHGYVTYFIKKDWKIMLCVNERLDLIQKYAPIKKEIIDAYAHCKFDRLSELLAEYDEKLKYHLDKTGMTIYFDKEIYDIYVAWMAHKGESTVGITKSIPKEWKKSRI